MIKYPNCEKEYVKKDKVKKPVSFTSANRGMSLEDDINKSNEYYLSKEIALIYKRPTPINVVKVDYTKGAKIIDAYYEKQSTTDYNGVYKGHYLDFEAKSTKSKTSIPLANISVHQVKHLKNVIKQGGIAFFIMYFDSINEAYLISAKFVIEFFENNKRHSIPISDIKNNGYLIKQGFNPRLSYLEIIEEHFLK